MGKGGDLDAHRWDHRAQRWRLCGRHWARKDEGRQRLIQGTTIRCLVQLRQTEANHQAGQHAQRGAQLQQTKQVRQLGTHAMTHLRYPIRSLLFVYAHPCRYVIMYTAL